MERSTIITKQKIQQLENDFSEEHLKYNLDYFSIDINQISSYNFTSLVKKHGFMTYALLIYLRSTMLSGFNYYIVLDDVEDKLQYFAFIHKVDYEKVKLLYDDFLKNDIITIVDCEDFLGYKILTDSYVVYNYELCNSKRKYEREKKRKQKIKENTIKEVRAEDINPFNSDSDNPYDW